MRQLTMKTETKLFTRADYMSGKCTHSEFYAQFVSDATKQALLRSIDRETILASKDPHFNDIPLVEWDNCARGGVPSAIAFKDVGDFRSKAGDVCILKEAARQIKAEA